MKIRQVTCTHQTYLASLVTSREAYSVHVHMYTVAPYYNLQKQTLNYTRVVTNFLSGRNVQKVARESNCCHKVNELFFYQSNWGSYSGFPLMAALTAYMEECSTLFSSLLL